MWRGNPVGMARETPGCGEGDSRVWRGRPVGVARETESVNRETRECEEGDPRCGKRDPAV